MLLGGLVVFGILIIIGAIMSIIDLYRKQDWKNIDFGIYSYLGHPWRLPYSNRQLSIVQSLNLTWEGN